MSIFERYAPFIQEFIYQDGWQSLRAVQVAAGEAVFNTDDNLLLCASTASGKTEAAFFPILTLFDEDLPISIGAIYIAPLKALINDQFERLNDLCDKADIPVWHWHGDVSQASKNKMIKYPSGILQITPESLEAMLIRRHSDIPRLFGDLRFIVIDEVHSLLRGDRGGQTLCLIERLSRLADINPRRIGLSATIGDTKGVGDFLSRGTGRNTAVPEIDSKGLKWRLSMEHFFISESKNSDMKVTSINKNEEIYKNEETYNNLPRGADAGIGYIFAHTRNKKCLVFVNSREECEAVTTTLRNYCRIKGEPDRFLIHHGNLSTSYRVTAEEIMKDDEQFQTTVTTATLELGIDIGKLERAFQINAPFTVSSFLQRMGRTGRRGTAQEMCFVIREEKPESRVMLPSTLPWSLLQGIAIIQLYLEERWVESPYFKKLPYSLLYHQTMSVLAANGEISPAGLASKILSLSYFSKILQEDYRLLLRHLISINHIEQTERGGLIVGLEGEKQINSFKFYAVFKENEEYTVRSGSQELGTIVMPPPVGEKIALAGHVWVVEDIDHKRHLIYCSITGGNVPAYFGQVAGDINTKILKRMQRVLVEEKSYKYLLPDAKERLSDARLTACNSNMGREQLICLGGNMWVLFPWLGTYSFLALERFLKLKCADRLGLKSFESARPYFMQFSMDASKNEFIKY